MGAEKMRIRNAIFMIDKYLEIIRRSDAETKERQDGSEEKWLNFTLKTLEEIKKQLVPEKEWKNYKKLSYEELTKLNEKEIQKKEKELEHKRKKRELLES